MSTWQEKITEGVAGMRARQDASIAALQQACRQGTEYLERSYAFQGGVAQDVSGLAFEQAHLVEELPDLKAYLRGQAGVVSGAWSCAKSRGGEALTAVGGDLAQLIGLFDVKPAKSSAGRKKRAG